MGAFRQQPTGVVPRLSRRQRILVTPREIAGVAGGLQQALGSRGRTVDVLLRWRHPFAYAIDPIASRPLRAASALVVEDEGAANPRLRTGVSLAVRLLLLPVIAARYGAVVFVGPDTLVRGGWDRRVLRRLGVNIVTVFCGSDARPPYLDGWFAGAGAPATLEEARAAVTRTRERVQAAERDSTYVVNHAGSAQFHRAPFLDWTVVGFAQRHELAPAAPAHARAAGPLRVLHAPSDLRMKGTQQIRVAIDRLHAEGIEFDYMEVSGRSHAEVQQLLQGADLVIDQLFSDAVLPGLATEAARAGTAVLVCGYAASLVADAARRTGAPVDHYAHPDELVPALRRLLTDSAHRASVADQLHAFVTTGHWSAGAIAARWERILAAAPDDAWFDQPATIEYAAGCAVSEHDRVAYLRAYVGRFGPAALELDHHPALAAVVSDAARV
ncbi:MAG: hypothetical protein QOG49_273 [Frankiaceae bacterium]|nr:hypothetical protein [Frankiaceae bacterium]